MVAAMLAAGVSGSVEQRSLIINSFFDIRIPSFLFILAFLRKKIETWCSLHRSLLDGSALSRNILKTIDYYYQLTK
jgi:hypothetical protein